MKISDEGSLNPLDDDDELHVVTMSGHNFSSSQAFYMQYSGTPTQVGRCLKQFQSSRVDWAFFKDKIHVNGGRLVCLQKHDGSSTVVPELRSQIRNGKNYSGSATIDYSQRPIFRSKTIFISSPPPHPLKMICFPPLAIHRFLTSIVAFLPSFFPISHLVYPFTSPFLSLSLFLLSSFFFPLPSFFFYIFLLFLFSFS
jgi:hypothetical protein